MRRILGGPSLAKSEKDRREQVRARVERVRMGVMDSRKKSLETQNHYAIFDVSACRQVRRGGERGPVRSNGKRWSDRMPAGLLVWPKIIGHDEENIERSSLLLGETRIAKEIMELSYTSIL